jgi:hypothetical protein
MATSKRTQAAISQLKLIDELAAKALGMKEPRKTATARAGTAAPKKSGKSFGPVEWADVKAASKRAPKPVTLTHLAEVQRKKAIKTAAAKDAVRKPKPVTQCEATTVGGLIKILSATFPVGATWGTEDDGIDQFIVIFNRLERRIGAIKFISKA